MILMAVLVIALFFWIGHLDHKIEQLTNHHWNLVKERDEQRYLEIEKQKWHGKMS